MRDEPVAGYDGGVKGFAATKPAEGEKFDPETARSRNYRAHLEQRQDQALRAAGARATHRYTETVSGFAADLTAAQAAEARPRPQVLSITPDEILQMDTYVSPDVLGLTGRGGVWAQARAGSAGSATAPVRASSSA